MLIATDTYAPNRILWAVECTRCTLDFGQIGTVFICCHKWEQCSWICGWNHTNIGALKQPTLNITQSLNIRQGVWPTMWSKLKRARKGVEWREVRNHKLGSAGKWVRSTSFGSGCRHYLLRLFVISCFAFYSPCQARAASFAAFSSRRSSECLEILLQERQRSFAESNKSAAAILSMWKPHFQQDGFPMLSWCIRHNFWADGCSLTSPTPAVWVTSELGIVPACLGTVSLFPLYLSGTFRDVYIQLWISSIPINAWGKRHHLGRVLKGVPRKRHVYSYCMSFL